MPQNATAKRRALLSVSDKKGLVPFAEELVNLSFELISTGGTAQLLREANLPVTPISAVTEFPEIMDGRVKTLHPRVHGGLLARAGIDDDIAEEHGIGLIDLLVVNLYPFEETIKKQDTTYETAIENIDVGGPAMLRAAAKNHARVSVVVDARDYESVLDAYRSGDGPPFELRKALAAKAFAHTAAYDALISQYLRAHSENAEHFPERLVTSFKRTASLRYGENPHQLAAAYRNTSARGPSVVNATQRQGKELSFNNLVDADAALCAVLAFGRSACVIVKHANPCGISAAATQLESYANAYACDPTSAFGGVIAFNSRVGGATADQLLANQFAEVVVAPSIDPDALDIFASKPNIRVLECGALDDRDSSPEYKSIAGGILLQDRDLTSTAASEFRVVTKLEPNAQQLADLEFAWTVVRFVKSNAIVFAAGGRTLGIGAGQPSRVMSTRVAGMNAAQQGFELDHAVMASDAFFPFRDGLETAAEYGIRAVIQPGGSMRDDEVIAAADELGLSMVFTGRRHFKH